MSDYNYFYVPYIAASFSDKAMKKWRASLLEGWEEYNSLDRRVILARCRDAFRNSTLAAAVINRIVDGAIGSGIMYRTKVSVPNLDADIKSKLESAFDNFVKQKFDSTVGILLNDFYELQRIVLYDLLVDGEVFVNFVGDRIQIITGDRVCTPSHLTDNTLLRDGIVFKRSGEIDGYYVRIADDNNSKLSKWIFLSANSNFIHVKNRKRSGELRGIPLLVSVLKYIRILDKYIENELISSSIASVFTAVIKTESSVMLNDPQDVNNDIYLAAGNIARLSPGESVEVIDPKRPYSNFFEFVKSVINLISCSCGLPFEIVLQSFNASYSASRAALIQAESLYKTYRNLIVKRLCIPYLKILAKQFLRSGVLPDADVLEYLRVTGGNALYHLTNGIFLIEKTKSIDELKDVMAAAKRLEIGVSTKEKEAFNLLGEDYDNIQRQLNKEDSLKTEIDDAVMKELSND